MAIPRDGRGEEESSTGQKRTQIYLLVLLGIAVIGAIVWFIFILPGFTSNNKMAGQCQVLCHDIQNSTGTLKDTKILDYCKRAFDLGEDKIVEGERQKYCKSGAHCFSRYKCDYRTGDLGLEQCINFVYEYYRDYNGEGREEAAQHIVDVYNSSTEDTGAGTCDPHTEWYQNKLSTSEDVLEVVN